LEFVAGEIIEVPSNAYVSQVAARISGYIFIFLLQHNLGHLTDGQGGYMVAGERYAPDVAYISKERQPELAKEGYNPNAPDLAVEVDFPSTFQPRVLMHKLANYRIAGTLVWIACPETKEVEVFAPGEPVKILGINDTLDGGAVLPGFTLPVKEIFPEETA
jgi:Uma2 family endonuclease